MKLYALCGSLRAASHNRAVLEAMRCLAPPHEVVIDALLPRLPLFNPDAETIALPSAVSELRQRVCAADGLIIASPEYARGIAAPLKNALEWLVGAPMLPGKPVLLVNTSPRASDAQAQLRLVLQTMSFHVVEPASVVLPLLKTVLDAAAIAAHEEFAAVIRQGLAVLGAIITQNSL